MEITGQNRYKTKESPITGSPLPHVFYRAAIIKPKAEVVKLKGGNTLAWSPQDWPDLGAKTDDPKKNYDQYPHSPLTSH